jgi:hypothetical protein
MFVPSWSVVLRRGVAVSRCRVFAVSRFRGVAVSRGVARVAVFWFSLGLGFGFLFLFLFCSIVEVIKTTRTSHGAEGGGREGGGREEESIYLYYLSYSIA